MMYMAFYIAIADLTLAIAAAETFLSSQKVFSHLVGFYWDRL